MRALRALDAIAMMFARLIGFALGTAFAIVILPAVAAVAAGRAVGLVAPRSKGAG